MKSIVCHLQLWRHVVFQSIVRSGFWCRLFTYKYIYISKTRGIVEIVGKYVFLFWFFFVPFISISIIKAYLYHIMVYSMRLEFVIIHGPFPSTIIQTKDGDKYLVQETFSCDVWITYRLKVYFRYLKVLVVKYTEKHKELRCPLWFVKWNMTSQTLQKKLH